MDVRISILIKGKKLKMILNLIFFKLMNNSVYGETIENIRKRCNTTVVDNEDKALKHIAKPSFINLQ